MVKYVDTTNKFKTKFFFAYDLAEDDGSLEGAASKWLKKKRDIKVVDVLYRHEIASPRYKDRSYVGIVYCDR